MRKKILCIYKNLKQIELNNHKIGNNQPPFIIAEAGINHNGNLEKALKMIEVAKKAGADAIKFQTFKAEEFISDPNQTYTYRSQGKEITESMIEMFKQCEFAREEWFKIKKKCDDEKILFLSSPLNKSDLDLLLEIGISAIKIPSMNLTDLPLLKTCSKTNLPIILSCGMSNLSEIHDALEAIGALDDYPTILLLTTSQYPTPPEDVNLLKLRTLSKEFPFLPIGFSDHTQGPLASALAVTFGACVFEKHFTLDHELPGPDHWFSENPTGLVKWVDSIRKSFIILGNDIIQPTEAEIKMKILARKSIVAIRDIQEGEVLDYTNLGIKRPGDGLPPSLIEDIIGKKTTKVIIKGSKLERKDFK